MAASSSAIWQPEFAAPLVVIASGAFGDKWVSWQREIATLSAAGSFTFTFTGTQSHDIHLRHAATVTGVAGETANLAGT